MDKSLTVNALQNPTYTLVKPANKASLGRYRLAVIPSGSLSRFDVPLYEGDVHYVKPKLESDYDERDEEFLETVRAAGVGQVNTDDELAVEDEVAEELTEEESQLIYFEKKTKSQPGVWCTLIECPVDLVKHLIGVGGNAKKAFEAQYPGLTMQFTNNALETKSDVKQQYHQRIWLPNHNSYIYLRHESSRRALLTARESLESTIATQMKTLPYTHFISLPLIADDNDEVLKRFNKFKDECLKICDPVNDQVEESIFVQNGRLHFTLCMLRLYYKDQVEAVCTALQEITKVDRIACLFTNERPNDFPIALGLLPPGLHIRLKGVHFMGDDITKADILYTSEAPGKEVSAANESKTVDWLNFRRSARTYIIALCQELFQSLCDHGVMDWQELEAQRLLDPKGDVDLNLHATLISSKFRAASSPLLQGVIRKKTDHKSALPYVPRLPFNAKPIVNRFGAYDFGVSRILGLHLSVRGGAGADSAYYKPEIVIPIRPKVGL